MDAGDRILFERSLQQAVATHRGPALDAACASSAGPRRSPNDTRTAVSPFFELQGAAHASSSSALDHVLAHRPRGGGALSTGVVLPALGQW